MPTMGTVNHMSGTDLAAIERQVGASSERARVLALLDRELESLREVERECDARAASSANTRGKIGIVELLWARVASGEVPRARA